MLPKLLLLSVCLAALCFGDAAAATLPADTTAILSGNASLLAPLPAPVADSIAAEQSMSQDGRFAAYVSTSDGLSAEDDDRIENVYVEDRTTGAVTLASRRSGTTGPAADAGCREPAISDDGRWVAF